jgi:hypothetical protein
MANNLWASFSDVNANVETVSSLQEGRQLSAGGGMSGPLPSMVSTSIAAVQAPEKFKMISIPLKIENPTFEVTLSIDEFCCLATL